jgi:hypothetical protein
MAEGTSVSKLMIPIYVVTRGEYSDYRIEGIFSTAEKAERRRRVVASTYAVDHVRVEQHELDIPPTRLPSKTVYRSTIDLDTGRMNEGYPWTPTGGYTGMVERSSEAWAESKGIGAVCCESTRSQAHANKLAVEARQKWLRERA